MADQYDDGGYTELAGGWCVPDSQMTGWPFGPRLPSRHYPDGILQPPTPYGIPMVADEHGFAHTSIGYVPITARRGGIQYPKPKGNTVAKTLNQQLAALKETQATLGYQIEELERKVRTQRKAPPADQSAWAIDVRFTPGGTLYSYLILRTNGMYYTTGNRDNAFFRTWTGLLEWLDSVDSHSALIPVAPNYTVTAPLEGRQS